MRHAECLERRRPRVPAPNGCRARLGVPCQGQGLGLAVHRGHSWRARATFLARPRCVVVECARRTGQLFRREPVLDKPRRSRRSPRASPLPLSPASSLASPAFGQLLDLARGALRGALPGPRPAWTSRPRHSSPVRRARRRRRCVARGRKKSVFTSGASRLTRASTTFNCVWEGAVGSHTRRATPGRSPGSSVAMDGPPKG